MKGGIVRALQAEVAGLKAEVKELREGLHAFRAHLHSEKFAGEDKDWINTADVLNWIRDLEHSATVAGESIETCPQCGSVMRSRDLLRPAAGVQCPNCNSQSFP